MSLAAYSGCFITLEGGEGSGKTSLLAELASFLKGQGWQVTVTREPGGTSLGEAIRDLVLRHHAGLPISSKAELFLFLAARAQHIEEKILPALQAGYIVLCDRFNDSTIAYQGSARGLGFDYVEQLCQLVCGAVAPQLTLYLDVPPEVGLARSRGVEKEEAASGELDRIESETIVFHRKIREAFQKLARKEPQRIQTVDATHSKEEVKNEAFLVVVNRLKRSAV